MACYQDLSNFECNTTVYTPEIAQNISEVTVKFGFSCTTTLHVYHEYQAPGKTSNLQHQCSHKNTLKEQDYQHLTRILKRNKCAELPQIAMDFNVGHQQILVCKCSKDHRWYRLLQAKSYLYTSVDLIKLTIWNINYMKQSFTPCLGPLTLPLDC